MRSLLPAFIFVFTLAFGLWVNDHSWNGQVYVYVGEQRSPAAVRTISDYSSLDHEALYRSAHSQLIANAEVFRREDQFGIQFGHPLVSRKGGGKEFGCQVQDHSGLFDRMEMVLVGVGVTDSGDAPQMIVDSECRSEADLNRLETVWIPMGEIQRSRAKDQMFQTDKGGTVTVHLNSISEQWPDQWVLWSVKLYREGNPEESLSVNADLMKQVRPKLLSLDTTREK